MDSSGSIGAGPYENAKIFVNELVRAYAAQSGSRVAVFAFSDVVVEVVGLTNTFDEAAMTSAILGAPFLNSITYTHLAINDAIAEFASNLRVPAVAQNLVLLTDGVSTDQGATTIAKAFAILTGIKTFSVGVGSGVDQQELEDFADSDLDRVFNANDFDELLNLLNPVSREICGSS